MLPKNLQISYPDFWQAKNFVNKINLDILSLIIKKGQGKARFSIIVPKKADKRATRRNAARRTLENWLRENLSLFADNYLYLFKIRKIINREEKKEILAKLTRDVKKELSK